MNTSELLSFDVLKHDICVVLWTHTQSCDRRYLTQRLIRSLVTGIARERKQEWSREEEDKRRKSRVCLEGESWGCCDEAGWGGGCCSAIDFGVVVLLCYSCDADQTERQLIKNRSWCRLPTGQSSGCGFWLSLLGLHDARVSDSLERNHLDETEETRKTKWLL